MQNDVYWQVGELVAISVVQGGSGFHVFNSSVYQYLCRADVTPIIIIPPICQVPEVEVREVLEQVHEHTCNKKTCILPLCFPIPNSGESRT